MLLTANMVAKTAHGPFAKDKKQLLIFTQHVELHTVINKLMVQPAPNNVGIHLMLKANASMVAKNALLLFATVMRLMLPLLNQLLLTLLLLTGKLITGDKDAHTLRFKPLD